MGVLEVDPKRRRVTLHPTSDDVLKIAILTNDIDGLDDFKIQRLHRPMYPSSRSFSGWTAVDRIFLDNSREDQVSFKADLQSVYRVVVGRWRVEIQTNSTSTVTIRPAQLTKFKTPTSAGRVYGRTWGRVSLDLEVVTDLDMILS